MVHHSAILHYIFSISFLQVITMSNIWRPVDYDSLSSQVHEDIDVVEISSEEEDLDSFGLPASGK